MLYVLLSPAKKLDFGPAPMPTKITTPILLDQAAPLIKRVKKYTAKDLKLLMNLSPNLADLNFKRFQSFDPKNMRDTKAAIYAFNGDVYMGLQAKTFSSEEVAFAQAHIGILSGLYGILRPMDAIQPYRLEMGTAVDTAAGDSLYDFWRDAVTTKINSITAKMKNPTIINLASEEYWSVIDTKKLKTPVVQCVFKEVRNDQAKVISFLAKKARGLMARFIIQHQIETPSGLKNFDTDGYSFDNKTSDDKTFVFMRGSK